MRTHSPWKHTLLPTALNRIDANVRFNTTPVKQRDMRNWLFGNRYFILLHNVTIAIMKSVSADWRIHKILLKAVWSTCSTVLGTTCSGLHGSVSVRNLRLSSGDSIAHFERMARIRYSFTNLVVWQRCVKSWPMVDKPSHKIEYTMYIVQVHIGVVHNSAK